MSKYTFHPEDLAQWLRECDLDDSKADLLWNRMKQFYDSVQEPKKKKWDYSLTCEDDDVEGIYARSANWWGRHQVLRGSCYIKQAVIGKCRIV